MSIGDSRRPANQLSTKAVAADDKKPDKTGGTAGKGTTTKARQAGGGGKSGGGGKKGAGGRPTGGKKPGGAGQNRRSVAPVKVNQGINWSPILMFGGAGLVALLIVGFATVVLLKEANKPSWQERAAAIPGIQDYLVSNPDWFKYGPEGNHKNGVLEYTTTPPVGGVHNPVWQSCNGDVYDKPIPKEQATHSLEHGAVWVAYQPDLPQDQVDELKDKVEGRSFLFMAPYPGLDKPISLQAWGYQLKVDNANDPRIDDFIGALRQNATVEPGASCSGGITEPGDKPLDLQADDASGPMGN